MGRTMRSREPNAVVEWVCDACRYDGIESRFLVDDYFFCSRRWEEILTGLVKVKRRISETLLQDAGRRRRSRYAKLAERENRDREASPSRRFDELAAAGGCTRDSSGSNRSILTT